MEFKPENSTKQVGYVTKIDYKICSNNAPLCIFWLKVPRTDNEKKPNSEQVLMFYLWGAEATRFKNNVALGDGVSAWGENINNYTNGSNINYIHVKAWKLDYKKSE